MNLDRIIWQMFFPSCYYLAIRAADLMAESLAINVRDDARIINGVHGSSAAIRGFVHPFTVLFFHAISFIGAFGALIFGKTLNIFSFIGLILLMGLVKKNAILLVDYTNVLRARGMSRRDAILQAGPVRLRPILMTTFAMIMGMLPIAIGIGEGAETRSPMALATIGGLLTSLLLTLVAVPVAYDLFDELQGKLFGKAAGSR